MFNTSMQQLNIAEIQQQFGNLTKRESEVLYYMIRGYCAREIADKLSISKRTVIDYINNIKNRWGVWSKGNIIEKAINMGYSLVIPSTLQIAA